MNERPYSTLQPEGFPGLPASWRSEWETFPDRDGKIEIFGVVHLKKEGPARRAAFVIHGQGEHGGRYLHFPHYLQDTFDAVYCLDLRGHGRSGGIQGHAEAIDDYVGDAVVGLAHAQKTLERLGHHPEWHLIGHSMGGLIATRFMLLHPSLPFLSATISSPLFGIAVRVPVIKKYAGYALANIWGSLQMATTLEADMVSHDPAVAKAYRDDQLNHNKVTPKFFVSLEKSMEETLVRAGEIHGVPTQFLVAMGDVIVDAQETLKLYEGMTMEKRRLMKYEGYYHEVFNEGGSAQFDKAKAFADVKSWVLEYSKVGATTAGTIADTLAGTTSGATSGTTEQGAS